MSPRSDSGRSGPEPTPRDAPLEVAEPGTALYVHLPHCVVKCTYCDFFSVVEERPDHADTVEVILREAELRAPRAPRTLFIGGGTPSLLGEADLTRLLEGLQRVSGFRESAREVTLESNPESLTPAKLKLLVELGVDRLSIGFQSFDPAILALFGRAHTASQALEAYAHARAAGFRSVSLDLIYGVPGQALADWERDLERVVALRPDHLSAYSLAFEAGTALTHARDLGQLEPLDEDLELAFFWRTREHLESAGYGAYEISNFALDGHRCAHNEGYWRNQAYVGLGPGAVSRLGPTRFGNPRSIPTWRSGILERGFGATWEETLTPEERLGETWWLGLRTAEGVDPRRARETAGYRNDDPGWPGSDPCIALAGELAELGLIEAAGDRWRLCARGLPLADAVSARFLDRREIASAQSNAAPVASGTHGAPGVIGLRA